MFLSERANCVDIKDISQGMGDEDGLCSLAVRSFELGYIDLVSRNCNVHKHGHKPVLKNRIERCRESGSNGDDFVTRPEAALAEFWRCKRTHGHKVRRGPRIDQGCTAHADEASQLSLKLLCKTARGKPAVERRVHHRTQVSSVNDLTRNRERRLPRLKLGSRESLCKVLGAQFKNLPP